MLMDFYSQKICLIYSFNTIIFCLKAKISWGSLTVWCVKNYGICLIGIRPGVIVESDLQHFFLKELLVSSANMIIFPLFVQLGRSFRRYM